MINEKLLELEYKYSQLFKEELFIFPKLWFDSNNDDLKIKILEIAIKEKKLIIDVNEGSNFLDEIINV